ncbi:MAG: NAD(P)/FAD-dependent oxidoreductase [Burkholderiaceae bacterium]
MITTVAPTAPPAAQMAGHFDVLIVGAGISGIDAAYYLRRECPGRTFTLLETQADFGGTWRTHKYPGIRSDSDLYTFGYKWKPWSGAPIASAEQILEYLDEVLDEQDLRRHVRYQHEVRDAVWSSRDKRWTLTVRRRDTGRTLTFTCDFLWMCQGYYRHEKPYTPEWTGMKRFAGTIVHPQAWPEDLDYRGKRVIVIGSGATAATIVPAIARDAAHVTMLQRSPTFFFARPNRNELADSLRELDLPEEWVHEIVRRRILLDGRRLTERAFNDPEGLRKDLMDAARAELGDDYDVDTHFNPRYRPWQQRLALIPDGDLFKAIRSGKASVVTDRIDTFTEKGILLESGQELEADLIVTATGFDLAPLGDIRFTIDGRPLSFADCWAWRGLMFSGVPNMVWVFGYFRSSWTLRADMIAEFVCRLFKHMDARGATTVVPQPRPEDQGMPALPFITPDNFNPGYITRNIAIMPRQSDRAPWIFNQDYYTERDELPVADLEDGSLRYG